MWHQRNDSSESDLVSQWAHHGDFQECEQKSRPHHGPGLRATALECYSYAVGLNGAASSPLSNCHCGHHYKEGPCEPCAFQISETCKLGRFSESEEAPSRRKQCFYIQETAI